MTELNGDRVRQQKNSQLFLQSVVSSSHQRKKRATIENNVSEDGNLQLHEKIVHTIIRETQSMQNSGQGIINKLAEDSKNNSFFRGTKTNWLSLKIVNTKNYLSSMMIF